MLKRIRIPTAALVLLLFSGGTVQAQQQEPDPDFTPACLHPALEQIAFLEGEWEIVSRQRVSFSEDRWEESRAHATWAPRLGGCALEEHWSGTLDGQPMQWIQILAYDHREETWEQVMIDWAHGNVTTAEGYIEEGKLIFNVPQMRRGRLLIDRTTVEAVDAGRVLWTIETSLDGGVTWVTFWTLSYSKP
jgi:hypothetical protein